MTLVTLCAIDAAGYYTGQSAAISAAEGCPPGWVRAEPPELVEGLHAYWAGDGWAQTDAAPGPSLDDLKAAKRVDVLEAYDALIAEGAPWDFGEVAETLQMRAEDRINWLRVEKAAEAQIAAGDGGEPCALPIRTTGNRMYPVTANEAKAITVFLETWGLQAMPALWAKKDAIDAAETPAAVAAVDATAWPSPSP